MKALLLAAALLVLAVPQARPAEVNFQIFTVTPEAAEGPTRERPYFEVGRRRISFNRPSRGRLGSAPNGLTIFLENHGLTGEVRIVNSAFTPAADFASRAPDYQDAAEATLPKEAEKAELVGAVNDFVKVNGWTSLGFEWKYTFAARPTHRQVTWLNLDPEHQICITMVSDEDSWKETSAVARRFVTSWYWLADDAK